jgi:pyrrolidone-carboxylate peptidase
MRPAEGRYSVRLFTVIAVCAALLFVPQAATAAPQGCYNPDATITYEESRIETPALPGGTRVPYELVEVGGFTPYVESLRADLCRAPSTAAARLLLQRHGAQLWRTAVARAQGKIRLGTIDRYDDRPLYWSRLMGTRDIRQWAPGFPISDADRAGLLKTYEYASRGVSSTTFAPAAKRVLISGFDPYQLNNEIRRSNPSGASALRLDGLVFGQGRERVQVQAVVLPVTWSGFDAGIVEDAFGPHLTATARGRADLIMTISQGNRGVMNIEQWAGAWRGGSPDNNNEGEAELIPPAPRWPQPTPTPEFIETSLPYQAMIDAATGPWPTALNPRICEWPAGTRPTGPVQCHNNGPSPGGQAQSGGGGNYLSNESMYRSNRLRLQLGATDIPGGHLHISALVYPADPLVIIDDAFTADRAATIEQTVALVQAAGRSIPSRSATGRR